MQMSSLFLSLSFYGLRLVLIDQSKYLCLSGKRYIGFTQEVYRFRSRGIYLSIDRYIRFIRKVYTFFYVMYTECDEENMTLRKFRRQERYREWLLPITPTDNRFATMGFCA